MAVEQEQMPRTQWLNRRGLSGLPSQHGTQQVGMVVIPSQQGHRREWLLQSLQQLPETDVAVPALVMAEIPADQQKIRGCALDPELVEGR